MQNYRIAKLKSFNKYLLIPVLSIIFFTVFYLVYNDIKVRTINDFNNEQLILARTASQGITSFFSDCQSDLTFLSSLEEIIDAPGKSEDILENYYETHKSIVAAITRLDKNGIILSTFPYNQSVIGGDVSYQNHVQQIIATHQPVISDVFMSMQGFLSIALHIPVYKDQVFAGSLAVLIPMDKLGQLYLGKIKTRGTGHAWLLSENGIEIYCSHQQHTGKTFLENTNHNTSATELLQSIKINNNGTFKGVHLAEDDNERTKYNEQYITFFRTPLGNTYWTILISCQEKDIYNALTRFRNHSIIVFTLLFIAIAFYFFSLAKVRNVLNEEAKRRKAEKTLQKSEEKFRKIFEDHSAIKILIDPENGAIIDANNSASKFYGWTRDELRLMHIGQINTLSFKELQKEIRNILQKEKNHFEFQHALKNGTIRDVEVFSSKIEIDNKIVLHSIIQDITERKRIEKALIVAKEQAEESNRLKTAFLQNMSHEIRTPMNAIMGFSSLIMEYSDDKPKLIEFSEIINNSCNNLLKIINDILDIAKIESGQLPVNNEAFKLSDLFAELDVFFKEHQNYIGKQHINFNLQSVNNSSENAILADKGKLRQILTNLISNAFKFTDTGKIEGGFQFKNNNQIIFYVSDTGIGIPDDKQDAIFERFTQLHHQKKVVYGGTGLGLSIVKGLVELLDGKIWLECEPKNESNENVGRTTFYFSIPYKLAQPDGQSSILHEEDKNFGFQNQTILLVDDKPSNTKYITEILSDTGLTIIHSEFGKEAVEIAINQMPDLILMDIGLPDISGYEATRQIKKQVMNVKIIAQTAFASTDDKQKAFDAGCDDYISKPLKRDSLLSLINKHLSGV